MAAPPGETVDVRRDRGGDAGVTVGEDLLEIALVEVADTACGDDVGGVERVDHVVVSDQ